MRGIADFDFVSESRLTIRGVSLSQISFSEVVCTPTLVFSGCAGALNLFNLATYRRNDAENIRDTANAFTGVDISPTSVTKHRKGNLCTT